MNLVVILWKWSKDHYFSLTLALSNFLLSYRFNHRKNSMWCPLVPLQLSCWYLSQIIPGLICRKSIIDVRQLFSSDFSYDSLNQYFSLTLHLSHFFSSAPFSDLKCPTWSWYIPLRNATNLIPFRALGCSQENRQIASMNLSNSVITVKILWICFSHWL